ncbi:MAG: hypothetical protein L0216_07190 [Planctomycetales bacterium]|nr:hypothetical protein [Planctomycetales bacterium]
MRHALALAAVLAGVLAPAAPAQEPPRSAQLKIRKVVLYKHGVGYFEREGPVEGDVTVPLSFKSAQMPDVLKSLYAVDLSGQGRISSIVYDSKDPLSKQLSDIMVRVPEGQALTAFLGQLKGAPVEVAIGTKTIRGRVLGIEPVQTRTESGVTTSWKLVLLGEDGAIRPLELLESLEVRVLDPALQKDLARMMEIYARARHADRKVVDLRAEGAGARNLRVGYIIETPIWKTSYRLLFEPERKPLIQGWAIVENRTDEDWEGVALTFVAGNPLSFVMDLYTSYYPRRPHVGVAAAAAEGAAMAAGEEGADEEEFEKAKDAGARRELRARGGARPGAPMRKVAAEPAAAPPMASLGEMLEQSLAPVASGAEAGELFAYSSKGPVSVKRGQAALVPILLETLSDGERVVYYRQDLSKHPQHAFLLKNSSGLTLEKGPVTVFEGSTCQGEGLLAQTLKPGMRTMLPYALETSVEVQPDFGGRDQPVTRATLSRGILTLFYKNRRETRYTIREKGGKARVFYLDHPRAGGYRLVEPSKPEEALPDHDRFRVAVEAGKETVFWVREETDVSAQVSIANSNTEEIRAYLRQTYLTENAKRALAGIVEIMTQRTSVDAELAQLQQERQRLSEDHSRIRSTLSSLSSSPSEKAMREKYLDRLGKADERMDQVNETIRARQERRRELDVQLTQALEAFAE